MAAAAAAAAAQDVDLLPHRVDLAVDERTVECTYLTRRLRAVVPNYVLNRDSFSWATPIFCGLETWGAYENPLPSTVRQSGALCIPYQVYNLIRFQMRLHVKLSGEDIQIPEISLRYLIDRFKLLPVNQRTFNIFLIKLHEEGFVSIQDYNVIHKRTRSNAHRYFIHYHKGFGHENDEDEEHVEPEFEDKVKSSILYHGGILAEIPMESLVLNPDEAEGPRVVGMINNTTGLPLAHAILIIGWLKQSKVFNLTLHNGVHQTTTVLNNVIKFTAMILAAEKLHQRD